MTDIHQSAVIGKNCDLADSVKVGPNCIIGDNVTVGENTSFIANVYVADDVKIGNNNEFFPTSVIGERPQILGWGEDAEYGGLVIGDNNVFREQVTIHPGMHKGVDTKIGSNNLLMIGVHIGHDCVLDNEIVMSNYCQIAGHCDIGEGVWFSGGVMVHQFITIGKWCYATAMSGINKDIPPFVIVSGHYPPVIRGVNRKGLNRAKFTRSQQTSISEAYKKLYKESSNPILKNAKELAEDGGTDKNVKEMAESIIKSSKQRYGRYLELFRD